MKNDAIQPPVVGGSSPWGRIQTLSTWEDVVGAEIVHPLHPQFQPPGHEEVTDICFAATAGHGGFWVSRRANKLVFEGLRCHHGWYEEDVLFSSVVLCLALPRDPADPRSVKACQDARVRAVMRLATSLPQATASYLGVEIPEHVPPLPSDVFELFPGVRDTGDATQYVPRVGAYATMSHSSLRAWDEPHNAAQALYEAMLSTFLHAMPRTEIVRRLPAPARAE